MTPRRTRRPSALLHHPGYDPDVFLNFCREALNLPSDRALARTLGTSPPQLSKFRARITPVTNSVLIRVHELSGLSFVEIREQLGVPPDFML